MTAKSRKQQLEELLAEDPNDPFLHYGLAMEYISTGDDEEAVRRLQVMFAATPEYVPSYLQAGQALTRLGRIEQAREVYQRGIVQARKHGEQHAAEEMQGLMDSLG
jgi:tetratricopeptide (TPR) repeat protein